MANGFIVNSDYTKTNTEAFRKNLEDKANIFNEARNSFLTYKTLLTNIGVKDPTSKEYVEGLKQQIDERLSNIPKDAQGNIMYDVGKANAIAMADEINNDENLIHIRDFNAKKEKWEGVRDELRAKGLAPVGRGMFGENASKTMSPLSKNTKTGEYTRNALEGWYEAHGDSTKAYQGISSTLDEDSKNKFRGIHTKIENKEALTPEEKAFYASTKQILVKNAVKDPNIVQRLDVLYDQYGDKEKAMEAMTNDELMPAIIHNTPEENKWDREEKQQARKEEHQINMLTAKENAQNDRQLNALAVQQEKINSIERQKKVASYIKAGKSVEEANALAESEMPTVDPAFLNASSSGSRTTAVPTTLDDTTAKNLLNMERGHREAKVNSYFMSPPVNDNYANNPEYQKIKITDDIRFDKNGMLEKPKQLTGTNSFIASLGSTGGYGTPTVNYSTDKTHRTSAVNKIIQDVADFREHVKRMKDPYIITSLGNKALISTVPDEEIIKIMERANEKLNVLRGETVLPRAGNGGSGQKFGLNYLQLAGTASAEGILRNGDYKDAATIATKLEKSGISKEDRKIMTLHPEKYITFTGFSVGNSQMTNRKYDGGMTFKFTSPDGEKEANIVIPSPPEVSRIFKTYNDAIDLTTKQKIGDSLKGISTAGTGIDASSLIAGGVHLFAESFYNYNTGNIEYKLIPKTKHSDNKYYDLTAHDRNEVFKSTKKVIDKDYTLDDLRLLTLGRFHDSDFIADMAKTEKDLAKAE